MPVAARGSLAVGARPNRFLVDRHPEHPSVLVVSACSGHAFKHSPAIGEAVAQWLTGRERSIDLGAFSFSRARS